MTNFLKETEWMLRGNGYSFDDVKAIQGDRHRISVEHFKEIANVEYNAGYGAQEDFNG